MPEQSQQGSPAASPKTIEPEVINVGILLRYFCPSCGREVAQQDQAELIPGNDYSYDVPAWPADGKPRSCGHCKTPVKTLPLAVSYIQSKPKS